MQKFSKMMDKTNICSFLPSGIGSRSKHGTMIKIYYHDFQNQNKCEESRKTNFFT